MSQNGKFGRATWQSRRSIFFIRLSRAHTRRHSDARAAAPAPSAARPKRKKGKRPAGSKWLNYLLCLGCLGSLSPLCFEYWGDFRSGRVLASRTGTTSGCASSTPRRRGGAQKQAERRGPSASFTTGRPRPPRDGRRHDGGRGRGGAGGFGGAGARVDFRGRLRSAPRAKPSSLHAAAGAPPSAATATATVAASANATVESSSSSSIGAHAATVINASAGSDDDDLADLRRVDRETAAKAEAEPARSRPGLACASAWARSLVQASTAPSGSVAAGCGPSGGIHDIIEGVGPNQTVFSVSGIPPPS